MQEASGAVRGQWSPRAAIIIGGEAVMTQEASGAMGGIVVSKGSPYVRGRSCSDAGGPWCYKRVSGPQGQPLR